MLFMYATLIFRSHMPIALTLGISIKVTPPTCIVAILNLQLAPVTIILKNLALFVPTGSQPQSRTLPSFITPAPLCEG